MHLPKLETPKYNLNIPSTKAKVSYRPFLVKEEKILLLAQESNDESAQFDAIKEIIEACTFGKVSADDLTSYDIEYIFLKLRSKSVGETSNINIKCSSCEAANPIQINLEDIKVTYPEKEVNNKIMLTDSIGIIAKPLSTSDISKISKLGDDQGELLTATLSNSIESIFDAENVYPMADAKKEEIEEFINSLNRSQITKIEEYIGNVPKLQELVKFTCLKCKAKNEIMLEGVQSFFE